MKNQLFVGISREVPIQKGGFLLIEDEPRAASQVRIFDPNIHSFNILEGLNYRRKCDIVETIDALFTRGESTLTKDTGLDFIADALDGATSLETLIEPPDKKSTTGHIWAYGKINRLMRSPVLRKMLCNETNFSFNPRSKIIARVNRAELGSFDALAVGLFLINQYRGQIIISDFGFYAREMHATLLHEHRLIAGVNFLDELPPKLRSLALLADIIPSGARFDDAEELAHARGHQRGTVAFNDYRDAGMRVRPLPPPQRTTARLERTRKFAAKERKQVAAGAQKPRRKFEGGTTWSAPDARGW
ncbi:MAG TPA: hypothetical protein VHY35_06455 [Stellaceae bacterium]|jgi:hypothetical protein|nr:hypothetical protein [Stellaceae bacterium]